MLKGHGLHLRRVFYAVNELESRTIRCIGIAVSDQPASGQFGRGRGNHIRPQEFSPAPPKPTPSPSFSPHFLLVDHEQNEALFRSSVFTESHLV
jgi:hypothetical protein